MIHEQRQQMLQTLNECIQECEHCYHACLQEEHINMLADCIQLDRECADICALTAKALSRESYFTKDYLELCAKICEECGKECEKHDQHEHCKRCAEACFKCADACRKAIA
ncbi:MULTISPECIES: four-helix bundle copper-binding protein [Bacillaceae]|uniref:four-helix bundle copper-binding protein n=1 Tax=Bacillaceae TaxID=186817 RepID=UPI0006D154E5|nr:MULTISPECIES: four-helix bundle copper-binding protein [Bacillaceae]